jgi:alkanesulfonate monooxygenase SsuD/methylene tetrahydromethanopterin reductase-like flavin-dependent oxidoreductase (luciferase family)
VSTFEVGLVVPIQTYGPDRITPRWTEIREMALRAEAIGFDTIWTPDELLWRTPNRPVTGFWEGVSIAGALAAVTTRATVGTWVLSALHRNPGIIAKAAETLDEISGGRFVFGLGAGHASPGQAASFGLPETQIFDRFDEALRVIVPLLRGGRADFEGQWHAARDLTQVPVGPRPGAIPIMIGANGPRGQRQAVTYADIWSCYAEQRSHVDELAPKLAAVDAICAELGRDPATLGRSAGVWVDALRPVDPTHAVLSGPPAAIADAVLAFRAAGFTRVELAPTTGTVAAIDSLAPVLERIRAA